MLNPPKFKISDNIEDEKARIDFIKTACIFFYQNLKVKLDLKKIYAADIVYTTHSAFGFDYLFNNLAKSLEERFMRDFYYVIIDEADLVLLDAAQMPLVIAGSPRVQSNLYATADFFVKTLVEGEDYTKEDK